MKRTLIIAFLLLAALTLTACGTNTVVQIHTVRWEAGETMVYNVYMDNTGSFSYTEVKGSIKIPYNITGTFTMDVIDVDETTMVTTAHTLLDVWYTYPVEALEGFAQSGIPADYIKTDGEDNISLRTTTEADVVFGRYSCTSVKVSGKGTVVIVGDAEKGEKNTVEFNDYIAEGSFTDKKATYTLKHNNTAYPDKEGTIELGTSEFTDNTALLYMIRSLTLEDLSSAGSMSMVASDLVAGSKRSVTVSSVSSTATKPKALESKLTELLGEEAKNKLFVCKASTGSTMRGSVNYFYMDTDTEATGSNVIHTAGQTISKNRILAMQQGYMVFVFKGIE